MKVYQEGGLRYKLQTLDDNAGSVKVYQLYKKNTAQKGKYCNGRCCTHVDTRNSRALQNCMERSELKGQLVLLNIF